MNEMSNLKTTVIDSPRLYSTSSMLCDHSLASDGSSGEL